MILDVEYFGYGLGLIMAGYICGLVVSYVFNLTAIIPKLTIGRTR
ncbi:MAG: hypothetical protein SCH71_06540 [Desulfobulbaceae bacterium]|nr:hypothetical protein [Desulfobulbaceae bacterium]